jgi:flagellar basal-body rod protein FlgC
MFRTLAVAASGLSAQRLRMETIATNVANAETTRTEAGGPYRRRVVEMVAAASPFGDAFAAEQGAATTGGVATGGVQVAAINEDASEGPLVYEPGHPDANKDGYVRYPNVRVTDEMVDLMDARRLYEANATVFQVAKSMLRQAIDI